MLNIFTRSSLALLALGAGLGCGSTLLLKTSTTTKVAIACPDTHQVDRDLPLGVPPKYKGNPTY